MNVKELILSQPAADIAAALIDRLDVEPAKRDKGIHRITALLDSLRGMEPETTDYMLLPQGYAFELSPWREVLGYEVNIANAQKVGIAALCAAVLYEMTFFGFDEEAVEAERQKLYDSLHEAEELDKFPPEERAKHFFSTEEVFAELDIPEPSEEARQETHRQMCREMLINSLRTYQMLEKYVKKQ